MEISIAKTSGFCFGVKRALDMIDDLLAQGLKVCTLGSIIHNKKVIDKLSKRGVKIVDSVKEIEEGYVLVIRSHGVPEEIMNYLEENSIKYFDATCPFVKKIHRIVKRESSEGKVVLIAGDKNHPEVKGISGYCRGQFLVFKNSDELTDIAKENKIFNILPIVVVAQTTFDTKEWRKCVNLTKNLFTNAIIYDTICNTTQLRQEEAKNLSKKSDIMLIIGDKSSSNTNKLYNICKENCKKTRFIESIHDLDFKCFAGCERVGVVAGASTPEEIIEEAKGAMIKHNDITGSGNENFEELLEESLKGSSRGGKVKGTVVSIGPNEVYVDVGMKQSGIIPREEFGDEKPEDTLKIGDELELVIVKTNDQEGTVILSKNKADANKRWEDLVNAYDSGEILKGMVSQVVKNGLLVKYKFFDVFIPSSHVGGNKSIPFESYVKKEVRFKIIELNKQKQRIIGSIREVKNLEKARKLEEFWQEIEVGKVYRGIVKSMTSYAVFVDLGCIDGIVHISELTWDRDKKPHDVVSVGQEIEVRVKSFDKDSGKVSLTYKDPKDNPWEIIKNQYKEGTVFEAEIVSIVPFGAFARIIPGVDGLIHISQISEERVESADKILKVGQVVKVKVREIDENGKRVSLTMKNIE